MSANQKSVTTLSVTPETLKIFNELSERTKIPQIQILHELAFQIKIILEDGIPDEAERIVFMTKADLAKSVVVLHFGALFSGCGSDFEEIKRKLSL